MSMGQTWQVLWQQSLLLSPRQRLMDEWIHGMTNWLQWGKKTIYYCSETRPTVQVNMPMKRWGELCGKSWGMQQIIPPEALV